MAVGSQNKPFSKVTLTGLALPVKLRPAQPMDDAELMEFSARNSPFRVERNAKGEVEIMTPVGGRGSWVELLVAVELGTWTVRTGGRAFSSSAGFSLPDGSVLSPDASWVSQEVWDALTPKQQESFPPFCPQFIIEVRSASDSRSMLHTKMMTWMDNGTKLAWLVDPLDKTVAIYRPGQAVEVVEHPQAVEAGPPVAGFRLDCRRFWE